ncbi:MULTISPECIES: MFS transporter [Pseudomonas]|uniref:Multidrug effflux MFS transporter n=1 Tax=Pseudomonas quercus TaxID=2722792 RepID=A0ABX0YGV0_9PSED|nr:MULTISPECIES: MFS transporter [Pseudomonas]MBF7144213.1 MFS transporter [Pseudomonas sp. LY10J]NJP02655.1 multidrug effflux MFS transporter [Pseudomonas quercus]
MTVVKPVTVLLVCMTLLGVFPIDVILPSIPTLATRFNSTAQSITSSIGLLTVLVALAQLIIGPASDRYSRKRLFIVCLALAIVGAIGATLADGIASFHTWRAVQALGCGGFVLAHALVQDLFDARQRTRQRIWLGTAGGVFISVSPLLGVFLEQRWGWQGSFWAFALIGSCTLALAAWVLPNRNRPSTTASSDQPSSACKVRFACASGLAMLAFTCHFSFVVLSPVIFLETLGTRPGTYGLIMLGYGGAYLLGGMLALHVAKRSAELPQVRIGLSLIGLAGMSMALSYACLGMTTLSVLAGASLMTLGVTLMRPAAVTTAMNALPGRAGTAAAGLNTLTYLGGGAITFLLGQYAALAYWTLPAVLVALAIVGAALCHVLATREGVRRAAVKVPAPESQ